MSIKALIKSLQLLQIELDDVVLELNRSHAEATSYVDGAVEMVKAIAKPAEPVSPDPDICGVEYTTREEYLPDQWEQAIGDDDFDKDDFCAWFERVYDSGIYTIYVQPSAHGIDPQGDEVRGNDADAWHNFLEQYPLGVRIGHALTFRNGGKPG